MEIFGGEKRDLEFSVKYLNESEKWVKDYIFEPHRIFEGMNFEFVPEITGDYYFIFNCNWFYLTANYVNVFYHLENGREIKMQIGF